MKKVVSLLLTVLMTLCVLSVNVLAFDDKPEELTVKVKYVVHANPVLTVLSEKTIFKGEKFDPLDVVVSAKDDEGTDLKSKVGVSGQYDVNTIGSYTLKYSVTDSFGGSDEKTFKLNVIEKLKEENTSEQVTVKEDAPVKEVEADIKTDSIVDSVVREEGNKTSTLTPKQKQAIKDGASVKLELTVDSTADVSANEDSKVIDKAIKETNSSTAIGALLDINLLCTVTKNNESLGTSKITVTSEPVKVTVTVPDTLVNTDSTVTRDYDVARLHDGEVDLLGAKYDAATKKLTFSTTKFSTYAIVYTDTKVEQPKNNTNSSSSSSYKKPVVNTGWGFSPDSIEFFEDSGSTALKVDGLPECNVLNVSYTQTLDLKSAEGKTVNANVNFVREITKKGDYTLTVELQNPSDKLAPGTYEGTINVKFTTKEYEAKIGDVYHETLEKAVDAAQNDEVVVLLKDLLDNVVIPENKTVSIDLNDHTLTNNGDHTIVNKGNLTISGKGTVDNITHAKAALYNEVGATVTLNGGLFTRSQENGQSSQNNGGNSYYAILNHGNMTINEGVSVVQNGQYSSLLENGWQDGSQATTDEAKNVALTINGGTFTGGLNTIKNDDWGVLTIKGGEFTNVAQQAVLNWNVATINGGTFQSDKTAIYVGSHDSDMDQGKLSVTGGTFNYNPSYFGITGQENAQITITGGEYSTNDVTNAELPAGYEAKQNDGKFDVIFTGNAFYTLDEFNTLTEIPEGITNVYLNIGDVSLADGGVTIGNKDICDKWTWDTNTNHNEGEILEDGRKVYMVRDNDTIYSSNKAGITLYISGSVKDNPEGGLNQSDSHAITFSIPDASNVVFTENFTVNGYFRMNTGWADGRNLGGAFYNRTVKSVLFDHSTFNGIWIQNGGFFADSLTLDGCTFNAYENKVSANDSNPLWFCNIRTCDVTVKNCTFKASRPIKVVEQGVYGAEVKILNNTFDMSLTNSANDASKPKNDAIMFSTITDDSTLGNVEVKGNTVTGATSLMTFFNPSKITMADSATFTVSDNTLNEAKTSVEWKTDTEYTPDFVTVN